MPFDLRKTVLLCPKNDEESVLILQIAKSAGIPTVVSPQEHGARLELEKDLEARLKTANAQASTIVIVETPGPEREQELEKAGYKIVIIDHHRYEGLDRMKQESSLDQFLVLFELNDARLSVLGFDPFLVKGIGMMDRGWVWELAKEGIEKADRKRIMDYYQTLLEDMGGLKTGDVESARKAWDDREEQDGVIIVRSSATDPEVHIRQALSSILAEHFDEPPVTLVVEGNGRVAVQDTEKARKLHEKFGGYVFGKDLCWGFAPTADRPAPSIDEIMKVLKE